jgi:hypothetical protein
MTIDYGCSVEGISFHHLDDWICLSARVYAGVRIGECGFFRSKIGIQANGLPAEISNCVFDSCEYGIEAGVWIGVFLIRNNLLLNSYNRAIYLQVESAIVENNIIINVPGTVSPGTVSSAVGGAPTGPVHIRNNVAINGAGGFGAGSIYQDDRYNNIAKDINRTYDSFGIAVSNDTIFNNLTIGCSNGIFVYGTENEIDYNAFWRNTNNFQYSGFDSIGNIFVNPMLVSDEDFHLHVYGGLLGESYVYQDLPPSIPDSLSGEIIADTAYLAWRFNTEADFSNYLLHRDTISGFQPGVFNLIAEPDSSVYLDGDIIPGLDYFYRISALDNQGNESDYSEELAVFYTGVWGGPGVEPPRITTIERNYPNPFNSQTTIVYYVADLGPLPADIRIEVYDITGRKVRTLLRERKEVGVHRITWDGRGDSGNDCPSGVYFARIVQWDLGFLGRSRKLVLMR